MQKPDNTQLDKVPGKATPRLNFPIHGALGSIIGILEQIRHSNAQQITFRGKCHHSYAPSSKIYKLLSYLTLQGDSKLDTAIKKPRRLSPLLIQMLSHGFKIYISSSEQSFLPFRFNNFNQRHLPCWPESA